MSNFLPNTNRVIKLTPNDSMIGGDINDIDHLFQLSHLSASKFSAAKALITDSSKISISDELGVKCGRYIDSNFDVSSNTGNIWFRGDVKTSKPYYMSIGDMDDSNDSTIFAQDTGSAWGFLEASGTLYDRCGRYDSSTIRPNVTYGNSAKIDKGIFIPKSDFVSFNRPSIIENKRTFSTVMLFNILTAGRKYLVSKSVTFYVATDTAGTNLIVNVSNGSCYINNIYDKVSLNDFHLMEVVFDLDAGPNNEDKLKLFVDGVHLPFDTMADIVIPTKVQNSNIQYSISTYSIDGILDEARLSYKTYGAVGATWRYNNWMNQSSYWTPTIVPIINSVSSYDGGRWRIQGTGFVPESINPTGNINDVPFTIDSATDTELIISQGINTPTGTKVIVLTNSDGEIAYYYDSVTPPADINPDLFTMMPPKSNFTGGSTVSSDTQYANPLGDVVDNSAGENLVDGTDGGNPVSSSRGGGGVP